jgi:hypothetical protein
LGYAAVQPQPSRIVPPIQNATKRPAAMNAGYSRYDQEIFQREPIAEFEIKTDLSFHGLVYY